MARWADREAACWVEADRRLQSAGVSLEQVQVAWIKLANAGPSGELNEQARSLIAIQESYWQTSRSIFRTFGSRI